MPAGPSASMEMGWACGAKKKVVAYIPALREPDLMIKMADLMTTDLSLVISFLGTNCKWCTLGYERIASAVKPGGFVHQFTPAGRIKCEAAQP